MSQSLTMSPGDSQITPIAASADALKRQLKDHSIVWIGAGASIAAGYPSAARLVAALKNAADDPITSNDFPEATDQFVRSRGGAALRVLLQREIGGGRQPTSFHRALAALARAGHVHTIITTNYDDLIERTLADHGVPCIVQTFEANFEAASRDTVRLIKVHGSYQNWSQVILSGESYARFAKAYRRLGEQLDVLCRQYPLTFVGSSLLEPRVLGWLAALKKSERQDLLPWRAFMTLDDWNLLLDYKTSTFEARTLLAGQFRPLILADHGALQTIWSEVAQELAPAADPPKTDPRPSPVVSDLARAATLLRAAVDTVDAVSYGAGPTTILHRRIELAERWLHESRTALSAAVRGGEAGDRFLDYLATTIADFSELAAEVKRRLPKAGEADVEASRYAPSAEFKHSLYVRQTELAKQFELHGLGTELDENAKWLVLGFEDREALDDYLNPRLAQLARSGDPRVRELLVRLCNDPEFSPAGLAAEGYRKSVVMDVVNAVLREEGASWLDRGTAGSKARARLTTSGLELIKTLMTD